VLTTNAFATPITTTTIDAATATTTTAWAACRHTAWTQPQRPRSVLVKVLFPDYLLKGHHQRNEVVVGKAVDTSTSTAATPTTTAAAATSVFKVLSLNGSDGHDGNGRAIGNHFHHHTRGWPVVVVVVVVAIAAFPAAAATSATTVMGSARGSTHSRKVE
jgi:hypothetical protein